MGGEEDQEKGEQKTGRMALGVDRSIGKLLNGTSLGLSGNVGDMVMTGLPGSFGMRERDEESAEGRNGLSLIELGTVKLEGERQQDSGTSLSLGVHNHHQPGVDHLSSAQL